MFQVGMNCKFEALSSNMFWIGELKVWELQGFMFDFTGSYER